MTYLGLAIDKALYLGLHYTLPFLPLKRPQREELETLQRVALRVCFGVPSVPFKPRLSSKRGGTLPSTTARGTI
ncbi:unnamed protein product [Ixodes pacificus]